MDIRKLAWLTVPVLLVSAAGIWYLTGSSSTSTNQSTPPASLGQPTPTGEPRRALTLDDVNAHATESDCWMVIEGKVYDVTAYIAANRHPGGRAIIEGCGKDATTLFNSRPMGSNTPHSNRAREGLEAYYIGDIIQQ